MTIDLYYYQRQKGTSRSVGFSDVQIVHKLAGWVTPNLDFKVIIFFNVKYLENGTRCSYTYNGKLISIGGILSDVDDPLTQLSRVCHYSIWLSQTQNNIRLLETTNIRGLLNYDITNELESPLKVISRAMNGFVVSKIRHIYKYEFNYNGQTLYVSNYFCCYIRLLYDAERATCWQ